MYRSLPAARRLEDCLLAGAVLLLGMLVLLSSSAFAWVLGDVGWRSWLVPAVTMLAALHFAVELLVAPRRLSKVSAVVAGAGVFLLIVARLIFVAQVYAAV